MTNPLRKQRNKPQPPLRLRLSSLRRKRLNRKRSRLIPPSYRQRRLRLKPRRLKLIRTWPLRRPKNKPTKLRKRNRRLKLHKLPRRRQKLRQRRWLKRSKLPLKKPRSKLSPTRRQLLSTPTSRLMSITNKIMRPKVLLPLYPQFSHLKHQLLLQHLPPKPSEHMV